VEVGHGVTVSEREQYSSLMQGLLYL
jgi:hypothetical protein